MRKILASTAAGVALLSGSLALASGFTGTANAQGSATPDAPSQEQGKAQNPNRQNRRRAMAKHVVKVAADTIGIDAKSLAQELKGGKSIAQVATEHGKDPQAVIDALVAKGNERIDKAVAAGKLDAARATTLKAKLPEGANKAVEHVFDGSRGNGKADKAGAADKAPK